MASLQTSTNCWHPPSEQLGIAEAEATSSPVRAIAVVMPSAVVDKPARRRPVHRLRVGRDGIFPW